MNAVCELHPGPHKHRCYALYLRRYINEVDIKQLSEAYDARHLPASIKKKKEKLIPVGAVQYGTPHQLC